MKYNPGNSIIIEAQQLSTILDAEDSSYSNKHSRKHTLIIIIQLYKQHQSFNMGKPYNKAQCHENVKSWLSSFPAKPKSLFQIKYNAAYIAEQGKTLIQMVIEGTMETVPNNTGMKTLSM